MKEERLNVPRTVDIDYGAWFLRVEALTKEWNDEADRLDEQVKRLEAVRDMVEKAALEPQIEWRIIQATTWRRCAIHLQIQINSQKHEITMAGYAKDQMIRELQLQGRDSELDQSK